MSALQNKAFINYEYIIVFHANGIGKACHIKFSKKRTVINYFCNNWNTLKILCGIKMNIVVCSAKFIRSTLTKAQLFIQNPLRISISQANHTITAIILSIIHARALLLQSRSRIKRAKRLAALIVFAMVQHVCVRDALSKINISHVLPFIIIHVGSGSRSSLPEDAGGW